MLIPCFGYSIFEILYDIKWAISSSRMEVEKNFKNKSYLAAFNLHL